MKRKILIVTILIIIAFVILSTVYYLNNYDNKLVNVNEVVTDPKFENITYDKAEDVWDDDVLGILTIEKIGLNATTKEGSSNEVLQEYIGHIESTPIYDGNIGLAAHNRGNQYSYFARINELEIGDIITYQTKFFTRQYKVDNIQTIFEDDWSLLENTKENRITLITCIANKKNQRLCVSAEELCGNEL